MSGGTIWTSELEADLTRLWSEGYSASECAVALGRNLTRNAVIGKVSRLKLPARRTSKVRPLSTWSAEAKERARRRREARFRLKQHNENRIKRLLAKRRGEITPPPAVVTPDPSVVVGAWDALPGTSPISLLMATDETCRWPIGDPLAPGFGFCGCPVDAGSVYCPSHAARATTKFKASAEDKRKLQKTELSQRIFA